GGTSGDVVVRIADQGVTTQRLADDAVTDPKIADNTVVRSINNITDHAQLTAGQNIAITPAGNTIMIEGTAGGDITSVNTPAGSGLTGGAVTGDVTLVIEDRGVTTQKLADAAVSTIKLGDGAVTSIKIADNAITSTKLADASVTAAKVSGNGATNGQTLSYDGMNVGWTTPVTGGTLDEAYDFGGPGMGKTITADAGPVTVGGTDGFLVTGTYGSGPIPATGGGARMMFYPGKAAFRSGVVNNTEWDDSNIGLYSTAMGAIARAIGEGAVSLGWQNEALGKASVALGGLNHAYADYSLAMGYASEAYAEGSTAMGYQVSAKGNGSTAMGYQGSATGNYATAFGFQCEASGLGSTASGYAAWSTGAYSTAFGQNTRATGYHSFAVGYAAVASGNTATAVGFNTTASGEKSTAMGSYVSTNGKLGSFILGDASTTSLWTSALPNQMKMRFAGGYQLYTNSTATTGVYMNGNTSGWINFSDRNRKENFTPVAGEWLLAKIRNLPVTEWNYKNSDPDVRYIGPMAQDFWQAFHLGGTDSLGINSIAIDGVNLAAIKALEERTAELQAATSRLTELTADASRSFEGEGQLRNGRVHIELDAEFARRAAIKESSPLKVFVQLEDDCNGVFITNKTATGFDVVELRRGRSNARFSYRVSVTQSAKKNSITMQISAPCTE
ncbi:MAG: tail fiber domain-containing protein, partial [Bacteroidetes bacterium]|nr:tail fiber domain-containing protein [Bacteroidota bacterium]